MTRPRFRIRRLAKARTLPWCVADSTRPYWIGRYATWAEARNATVGAPPALPSWIEMVAASVRSFVDSIASQFSTENPDDYARAR
jgi:hypothetical protein